MLFDHVSKLITEARYIIGNRYFHNKKWYRRHTSTTTFLLWKYQKVCGNISSLQWDQFCILIKLSVIYMTTWHPVNYQSDSYCCLQSENIYVMKLRLWNNFLQCIFSIHDNMIWCMQVLKTKLLISVTMLVALGKSQTFSPKHFPLILCL